MRFSNLSAAFGALTFLTASASAVELVKNGDFESRGPEYTATNWVRPDLGMTTTPGGTYPENQAGVGNWANQYGLVDTWNFSGRGAGSPGTGSQIPTSTLKLGGLNPNTSIMSQGIDTAGYGSATLTFKLVYEDLEKEPYGAGRDFFYVYFDNTPLGQASTGQPIMTVDIGAPAGGGLHCWYLENVTLDLTPYMDGTVRNLSFKTTNDARSGSSSSAIVDNVSIQAQAVPEPATMAALGLGAAALVRRRRTR